METLWAACKSAVHKQYISKSSLESSWIWGWAFAFIFLNEKHVQNSNLPPVICFSYVQGNGTLGQGAGGD